MENTNIIESYSKEKVFELLKEKASLLDYLVMYAEEIDKKVDTNHKLVMNKLSSMDSKIDSILEQLSQLMSDFSELKNENREIEQKILLMNTKLSKVEKEISEEDIEDYYTLAENMYSSWEEFDPLTRKFIPMAEYLYSKLQNLRNDPDYSPVVLELCRAIENEFLLKVFKKYTMDLIWRMRTNESLNRFLSTDRSDRELNKKTGQFVKAITKAFNTHRPEYTLGQMNTILSLTKERDTLNASPLLQDFVVFLEENTTSQSLLNSDYIRQINNLVNRYRNPSAHPEFISRERAEECKEIMPERLDYFMECLHISV